jgi:hypothetical protein
VDSFTKTKQNLVRTDGNVGRPSPLTSPTARERLSADKKVYRRLEASISIAQQHRDANPF